MKSKKFVNIVRLTTGFVEISTTETVEYEINGKKHESKTPLHMNTVYNSDFGKEFIRVNYKKSIIEKILKEWSKK